MITIEDLFSNESEFVYAANFLIYLSVLSSEKLGQESIIITCIFILQASTNVLQVHVGQFSGR